MNLQLKPDTRARLADVEERARLVLEFARVLYTNGQSTDQTLAAAQKLAAKFGLRAVIYARWGELQLQIVDGDRTATVESLASPSEINMARVAAAMRAIEDTVAGRIGFDTAANSVRAISDLPPASTGLFTIAAAGGAVALAVIFGIEHIVPGALIFGSAAAGALIRRALERFTGNLLVQPLCAAILAGIVGAVAARYNVSSSLRLVAVCPCMILVPGPHILNAALDCIQGRIQVGAARAIYATLIITSITIGLLAGLTLGGTQLPVEPPGRGVPLAFDAIAAGVAVASYSIFFSAPLRMVPVAMIVGMLAHAFRWIAITLFLASSATGAFIASVIVGLLLVLIARRTQTPFAAIGFASVVSMMPGVFLFRMGSGLEQILHGQATLQLIVGTISDGITAASIILAISLGLIVPKLIIDYFGDAQPKTAREAG